MSDFAPRGDSAVNRLMKTEFIFHALALAHLLGMRVL